jgi:hypothetical protein
VVIGDPLSAKIVFVSDPLGGKKLDVKDTNAKDGSNSGKRSMRNSGSDVFE